MKEHSQIEVLSGRVYARKRGAQLQGVSEHGADDVGAAQATGPAPLIDSRYVPGKRVGSGRFGEIYEALDQGSVDLGLSRSVAVQLIDEKIAADPRTADSLARAYAALRVGSHPNVVRIVDFGRQGRALYLVMDLLDGVSLRSVLDESAPEALELEEVESIVLAVGQALQYLHAKGIVYGRLRPEDVFITFDYQIKLLDVAPADLPGTPYYVEDAGKPAGRERDARDDVYGLACLTYELVSGRHPFNANSPLEAQRAGLQPRPVPGLTARRWDAISRGLRLQRAERTATVGQFLDAFGLSGNERLRAAPHEDPRPAATAPPPTPHDAPPAARWEPPVRAVPLAPPFEPAPRVPPPVSRAPRPVIGEGMRPARPPSRPWMPDEAAARGSTLRTLFAFVFVASIAGLAFFYYAEFRGAASDTMTMIEARRSAAPGTDRARAPETAPPASTDSEAGELSPQPLDSAAAAARAPAAQTAAAASSEAPARQPPASAASPTSGPLLGSSSVAGLPVRSGVATAGAEPFVFDHPVLAVSERMSAVSIAIRRSGDLSVPASAVWWASEDTAKADEDYAELGQRVERFAAGEDSRTILIPLIGDSEPERTESFFVYVGRGDASRSHVDVLSSVRVDIIDDD